MDPDSVTVFERWLSVVSDFGVSRVHARGARLVANILTLNVGDFARYAALVSIVHPWVIHHRSTA